MIRKFLLKNLNKHASKWVVLSIDLFLIAFCFVITHYVRYLGENFSYYLLGKQLAIVVILALVSFLIVGSYKGIIRHTGSRDIINVFFGVAIFSFSNVCLVLLNKWLNFSDILKIPRSILLIHFLISVFALTISRYFFKAFYEIISSELATTKNILIYGAGDSGIITYGALNRERNTTYNVVGFIDNDVHKINKKIDRVKIYDPIKIDKNFIEKHEVDEVIISIQNVKANTLLEITDSLLELDVHVKIVPPLSKWIDGDLNASQIKQVNIDDLLGRQKISINNPIVQREVSQKVVLVTGAAGSIGSEIARQLSTYKVKLLILIDQAESPLYDLQQELVQKSRKNFKAIVADVRDVKRMTEIFELYKPQRVFHAAAYKHVPLMEESPYEAVKINISGTRNMADLSVAYGVERFVMVSTDKAVNPTNVMGATKRVAEMYITCLSKESHSTKFTITRFGNVLGSNGSVIPLFKKQIENGGPLTLTHKDITRYFMTIPEACSLVLEAGTMGVGGEIYIFDMGKSVKIFDLAKRMISLSGLKYPEDIAIEITGLRPGEKLYEELLANGENTIKTYHDKIMIAKPITYNDEAVKEQILTISIKNNKLEATEIVSKIKDLVPEYISNNSSFEKLD